MALKLAEGNLLISVIDGQELSFSQSYACEEHDFSIGELSPRMFSFNAPIGACPHCSGLGEMKRISFDLVVPHKELSLSNGAIQVNGFKTMDEHSWNGPLFAAVGKKYGFTLKTPIQKFSPKALEVLKYGDKENLYDDRTVILTIPPAGENDLRRILNMMQKPLYQNPNMYEYYEQFMIDEPCPDCGGGRLNPAVLGVTVGGKNIHEVCRLSVTEALNFIEALDFTDSEWKIAHEIIKEIKARLGFFVQAWVGISDPFPHGRHPFRGRGPAYSAGHQIGSALMGFYMC